MNTSNREKDGGHVLMIMTLLILIGCMVFVFAIITIVKGQVRVATEFALSKDIFIYTEGMLEEVVYRHLNHLQVLPSETFVDGIMETTITSTDVSGDIDVLAVGRVNDRVRKIRSLLSVGDGASFVFGIQAEDGGIIMENNSVVHGNVYSNGPIIGSNLNKVNGTAISAGPSGYISEIHATGSAYANTIEDSYIEMNAFYNTIDIGTVVDGTKFPGSPNMSTSSLPIPDSLMDMWENYAASSSVMSAECASSSGHIVYDTDVTLGPAKIPCDVTFEKFPTVTFAGVVWIEGNLEFSQGPEFEIHPAIGNKSVPIIVSNPADRLTSGTITMRNSGTWTGNGNRSYILLLSRNESAEQGGSEKAITIQQSNGGDLLVYAGHGEINLQNNTDLTEITAYRVRLENFTEVNYDNAIARMIFNTGFSGDYVIDSWQEVVN